MKSVLFATIIAAACLGPMPVEHIADDTDPKTCSDNYPFETPPDDCESSSYGTCCMWLVEEKDEGTCRYDYCTYHEDGCEWHMVFKECHDPGVF